MKISNKKFVVIKLTALFLRLTAIAQRENNIKRFFSYELTTFPMTFFKDGLMRKPKKGNSSQYSARQKKLILTKTRYMYLIEEHFCTKYDGLRASFLEKFTSFMLITSHQNMASAQLYLTDTAKHHLLKIMSLQEKISIRGAMQMFNAIYSTKVNIKQHVFLSSSTKKPRFTEMLSSCLIKSLNKVITSHKDAHSEIARCVLHVAETGRRVNVVADNTDVALLLLYHWKSDMTNIKFTSERSKATFDISSSLL